MKTNLLRNRLGLLVGLSVIVLLGITVHSAAVQFATGVIPHSELFDGPARVTVQQRIFDPGEILAWHHHPGRAYTVIKRGTLTLEDGCGGEEVLTAGQAFEEVHSRIHRAKNLSTDPVEVFNTFIVPDGSPTTIPTLNNERLCGPPTDKSECKNDGWINFSYPRSFSNQGDCISFVTTASSP